MRKDGLVSVIDYGVANIGSLMNMHRKCGIPAERVSTPEEVRSAGKLVLPGVGSFDNGMSHLMERGLVDALRSAVLTRGTPILGICLGMQLLGRASEEGKREGLSLVDAECERFQLPENSGLKVPHRGWGRPNLKRPGVLLDKVGPKTRFYFSHSYHMVCGDESNVVASAAYGVEFTAMIQAENVMGVQFHPEKSHRYGMELLRRFAGVAD